MRKVCNSRTACSRVPKEALRRSHVGITLNDQSAQMERRVDRALEEVKRRLLVAGHQVGWQQQLPLDDIIRDLNARFPMPRPFTKATNITSTSLKPDGGFLYVRDRAGQPRCVLVTEAKRQGTNDAREKEGKPKQARGNAIERLGKNLRGVEILFAGEDIVPFVCFGEGCDFASDSSILDRVATLNQFFPLNVVHVRKIRPPGQHEVFRPVSLFFREPPWSPAEMVEVMWSVVSQSLQYYDSRYGLKPSL